ncbi:hypothetical protein SeLEV6574_g07723 [Synchytrium endobioticum]|uniref:Uncharacterized protein n=1 Tax=Synchytrium endobioticum TaxID=286115 RepID=A0A507CL32_9FUNG|nr:hypothetical protein SeLEV6574_g07723 [Synchytrium endobioticum]
MLEEGDQSQIINVNQHSGKSSHSHIVSYLAFLWNHLLMTDKQPSSTLKQGVLLFHRAKRSLFLPASVWVRVALYTNGLLELKPFAIMSKDPVSAKYNLISVETTTRTICFTVSSDQSSNDQTNFDTTAPPITQQLTMTHALHTKILEWESACTTVLTLQELQRSSSNHTTTTLREQQEAAIATLRKELQRLEGERQEAIKAKKDTEKSIDDLRRSLYSAEEVHELCEKSNEEMLQEAERARHLESRLSHQIQMNEELQRQLRSEVEPALGEYTSLKLRHEELWKKYMDAERNYTLLKMKYEKEATAHKRLNQILRRQTLSGYSSDDEAVERFITSPDHLDIGNLDWKEGNYTNSSTRDPSLPRRKTTSSKAVTFADDVEGVSARSRSLIVSRLSDDREERARGLKSLEDSMRTGRYKMGLHKRSSSVEKY